MATLRTEDEKCKQNAYDQALPPCYTFKNRWSHPATKICLLLWNQERKMDSAHSAIFISANVNLKQSITQNATPAGPNAE